jgi:hypothetical protein
MDPAHLQLLPKLGIGSLGSNYTCTKREIIPQIIFFFSVFFTKVTITMSNFYSVLGEDNIGQEGEQKLVDVNY